MNLTADLQNMAKRDLVAEVARQFGEVRLKVTGTSMLPSVWPGDILTVRRRSAGELLPGQIVLCYRNQGFVGHRLVAKRGDALITRGDSLPYEDRPFRDDEVLGEVVSILRDGRSVDPSPAWWHGAGSWILRHSELCTRVLLRLRRLAWAS
jgi:signal peptidase I